MRDHSSWSLNLGQWGGVQIRLHASFFVFAVLALYVSTLSQDDDKAIYGPISLGLLLLSVILHELGHCAAAVRLGGGVDQITLGPLGGLSPVHVPQEPRREALAAISGPAANLAVCVVTGALLIAFEEDLLGLANPLQPREMTEGSRWMVTLKLTWWLNWVLFLVNILPAYPMDGGRAVRAWLTPVFDHRTAVLIVGRAAKLFAIGMCIVAALMHDAFPANPFPLWAPVVLFAIFLFFSAKQEVERLEAPDPDDDLLGYDFSQGYTSLERQFDAPQRRTNSGLRRWLEVRRAARERRRMELEEEEERRLDEVLMRLHATGMSALSADERALLDRASARYRNRLRN